MALKEEGGSIKVEGANSVSILVAAGTNYELSPPASAPVKVVRTIFAEADGVPSGRQS